MATYEIIWNPWYDDETGDPLEEWISLEDKSFLDADVFAQLARAFQSAYTTVYGTPSTANLTLYDLGNYASPEPDEYEPLDESGTWTKNIQRMQVRFLLDLWFELAVMTDINEYEIDSELYSWGHPDTQEEDPPTYMIRPPAFMLLLGERTTAAVWMLGGGIPGNAGEPTYITERESWLYAVTQIRAMLDCMRFLWRAVVPVTNLIISCLIQKWSQPLKIQTSFEPDVSGLAQTEKVLYKALMYNNHLDAAYEDPARWFPDSITYYSGEVDFIESVSAIVPAGSPVLLSTETLIGDETLTIDLTSRIAGVILRSAHTPYSYTAQVYPDISTSPPAPDTNTILLSQKSGTGISELPAQPIFNFSTANPLPVSRIGIMQTYLPQSIDRWIYTPNQGGNPTVEYYTVTLNCSNIPSGKEIDIKKDGVVAGTISASGANATIANSDTITSEDIPYNQAVTYEFKERTVAEDPLFEIQKGSANYWAHFEDRNPESKVLLQSDQQVDFITTSSNVFTKAHRLTVYFKAIGAGVNADITKEQEITLELRDA